MSFALKAAQNRGLACRHPGCNIGRASISPYCDRHAKAVERFGHPDGRSLSRKRDYGVELTLVSSFIARHDDHAGVIAAVKWLQQWLDAANLGKDVPGRSEIQRLSLNGVSPESILTEAAALFLLSRWNPRSLQDDERLTFAIGIAVCRLAPPAKRYGSLKGKPRLYSKSPGKVARREIGRRIRLNLGPLLMNISEAIFAEDAKAKDFDRDLRRPFQSEVSPQHHPQPQKETP